MPTVAIKVNWSPAIKEGADITSAAVQTLRATDGLYRRIPTGTLTQDIRLRLSHDGVQDGTAIIVVREDTGPYRVTIEDWNGAVVQVISKSQQWTVPCRYSEADGVFLAVGPSQHA